MNRHFNRWSTACRKSNASCGWPPKRPKVATTDLTSVDKANVLEPSRLWRQVAARVMAEEFPDVKYDVVLVDAMAMHLINRPRDFDVVVTGNMFGDILTDEASMLARLAWGCCPVRRWAMAVPVCTNRFTVRRRTSRARESPIRWQRFWPRRCCCVIRCRLTAEADAIEAAVARVLADGLRTADIARGGESIGTEAMGTAVVERLSA